MTIFPFVYKAYHWNIDTETEEVVKGVTFANSFVSAMRKIEKYYGDELLSIELTAEEENEIYEFDEQ